MPNPNYIFANTINGNPLYADRAVHDAAGNDIQTTYATKSELPAAQVQTDWDASSGMGQLLNKPDLSIYAQSADLAAVATTGSYNSLTDTPSIPAAQVNADWDATSGASEILNKPVPKTLTAGTGISITESANAITVANTATPPTVDQTYDDSSTNAQSGVAVASAIAALGTWTDVSSEITKSTTIITGGSITFRYNATLKLISLIGEIHVQGDGDVYTLPAKYRPQTNFTCANPVATSYIDYTPSTGKFVARSGANGYFSWTMTMPCLGE